ncbi:MAG: tryptophan--tRNA ligase, partial [Bacteroidota bacterium]
WLASKGHPENTTLYRQSAIARVTELSWYLSCFTPVGLLRRSHAFKEKSKVGDPKAGLMFYPVLMAADILLYDATHVPVGKDQQEHLDITRDVGRAFNHRYGDAFVIPEAVVSNSAIVPGTDGKKMSKSRRNRINVFHSDDELRNAVMSIKTDSLGLRDPKSPDKCTVFRLFELVADHNAVEQMRIDYGAGAIGYGDAKQLLFEAIQKRYSEPRDRYHELVSSKAMILEILDHGEQVANRIANNKMEKVRSLLGF